LVRSPLGRQVAARAAQEQGKFWEYHDILYQTRRERTEGPSQTRISSPLRRKQGSTWISSRKRFRAASTRRSWMRTSGRPQEAGIQGTPSFLINGRPLVGAQPLRTFAQAIEEAEAGNG
jgi:hypothetical protein